MMSTLEFCISRLHKVCGALHILPTQVYAVYARAGSPCSPPLVAKGVAAKQQCGSPACGACQNLGDIMRHLGGARSGAIMICLPIAGVSYCVCTSFNRNFNRTPAALFRLRWKKKNKQTRTGPRWQHHTAGHAHRPQGFPSRRPPAAVARPPLSPTNRRGRAGAGEAFAGREGTPQTPWDTDQLTS